MESAEARADAALLRWRLVLGPEPAGSPKSRVLGSADEAVAGDPRLTAVDRALDFLYGTERGADLSASLPYVATWLGDIRRYFPRQTVAFLEREAIARRGLRQLLFEPEVLGTLEKDIHLVTTILGFKDLMPEETRRTAREVVAEIVAELRQRLETPLQQAITGALQRNRHAPLRVSRNLDVRRTIQSGLRNYQPELGKIVPERLYFYASQRRYHEWRIIVLVDQSGSMAESIVYAAIFAAVFASLPALETRLLLFDTATVDLTDHVSDPVEVLFSAQLGGGTDIARAVATASELVEQPERTLLLLITDLHEGGDREALLDRLAALVESRVRVLCALALNDAGVASYNHQLAREVANVGVPAFAATPNRMVEVIERALRGESPDGSRI
ncbi:MAG TPA: VWA domain-containing protein [Thermomicrobiales bacterium]